MIPIRDDQPRFSTPFVNYFIVALNALAFFYELSIQTQGHRALDRFVYQFGVVPTHVELALAHLNLAGVFLPILTSMFLHGSWLHIIGNMWVLWIFGDNIEDHLGHFSYLSFYLISGFAAAFTHILLNLGSNIPSVGASRAIARVMGAYFVLYPRPRELTLVPLIVFFTVSGSIIVLRGAAAQGMFQIAVSVAPGRSAITRIPFSRSSSRSVLVNPNAPCFEAL